ncbi:uncharacterized protein B0H18DRAFT_43579 [Fomitopsis serialis]|uniref:uncharacterized protein n=1 Tax=Fomitopsis serialis TaxID=139415 RepID=UPI002008AE1B|nr:uncharacterized protein B0H18DRAFT_43579 [Neoantrodia serialis]KAH9917188.1 hypothetical protein B0H18DRAFT_43579 [Neoantrodia serialis]
MQVSRQSDGRVQGAEQHYTGRPRARWVNVQHADTADEQAHNRAGRRTSKRTRGWEHSRTGELTEGQANECGNRGAGTQAGEQVNEREHVCR